MNQGANQDLSAGATPPGASAALPAHPPIWRRGLLASAVNRLIAAHLGLLLLGAGLVLGSVFISTSAELRGQLRGAASAEAQRLLDDYRDLGVFGLVRSIQGRVSISRGGDGVYTLVSPSGVRLAGNLTRWPETVALDGRWAEAEVDLTDGRKEVLIEARAGRLPGGETLLVGRVAEPLRFFKGALWRSMLIAVAVFGAISVLGAALLSRFLRRRLKAVAVTAGEIMQGDLDRRMALSGTGDEFDRLAERLNAMLDRISKLVSDLRMVTDSVAHDLRSPLTRLRGHLESALTAEDSQPGPEARERIEKALVEAEGALTSLSGLIDIARAEAGVGRDQFETVDVAGLVFELAELYEPAAEEAGVRLAVSAAQGLRASGHRQLLAQAVSNLIENALKHAPKGSEIRLSARGGQGEARVGVSDRGPGIPATDRARATRRFERLDPSRGGGGFGLGLALAAAVARLHGGTLELRDAAPGSAPPGLEAAIRWPTG